MLYLLGLILLSGIVFALQDFRRHFLLLFLLINYFIYFFLGPLNSINRNMWTHLKADFRGGFEDTVMIYTIGIASMLLGYLFMYVFTDAKRRNRAVYTLNPKYPFYMWFFFLSLVLMIFRNVSEGVYGGGFYNYLVFLGDSLILAFIILIYEKKFNRPWHWFILGAAIFCYLILGFRYRILLLIIGVLYHFLVTNRLSLVSLVRWVVIGVSIAYTINFITVNREALSTLNFNEVTFESDTYGNLSPYQLMLHQTDNYKTEMMVMQYINRNHIEYDYGESMFLHIFIRIIPASFFEGGVKPSIPQLEIIKNSFGTKAGYFAGAAVSNVTEYYIAFGKAGVVFFMLLLGGGLGYISKRTDLEVPRDRVVIVMIAMVLFQESTRGYLPQNVTLLVFLLITLQLFYRKKYVSYRYQYPHAVQDRIL